MSRVSSHTGRWQSDSESPESNLKVVNSHPHIQRAVGTAEIMWANVKYSLTTQCLLIFILIIYKRGQQKKPKAGRVQKKFPSESFLPVPVNYFPEVPTFYILAVSCSIYLNIVKRCFDVISYNISGTWQWWVLVSWFVPPFDQNSQWMLSIWNFLSLSFRNFSYICPLMLYLCFLFFNSY